MGGRFGLAGAYTDRSGLSYMNARYYNPATGTFLSRDPVRGVMGGSSISFNPYPYANNNPVNYTDPTGEFPWLLVGLFLLGVGIEAGTQYAFEGEITHPWMLPVSGILTATGYKLGQTGIRLGWSVGKTLLVGAGFDLASGYAADRYIRGESFSTAFYGNLFSAGIGLGFGVGTEFFSDTRLTRAILGGIADFEKAQGYAPGSVIIATRPREVNWFWQMVGIRNKPVTSSNQKLWGWIPEKIPGGLRRVVVKETRHYRWAISDLDLGWAMVRNADGTLERLGDEFLAGIDMARLINRGPDKGTLGYFINRRYGRDIIQHGAHVNAMFDNAGYRITGQLNNIIGAVDDLGRIIGPDEYVRLFGAGGQLAGSRSNLLTSFMRTMGPTHPNIMRLKLDEIYEQLFYYW